MTRSTGLYIALALMLAGLSLAAIVPHHETNDDARCALCKAGGQSFHEVRASAGTALDVVAWQPPASPRAAVPRVCPDSRSSRAPPV